MKETIDQIIDRLGVRLDNTADVSAIVDSVIDNNIRLYVDALNHKKSFDALVGIIVKANPNINVKDIVNELNKKYARKNL